MSFLPSEDRVKLKPIPPETQLKSGLIIPIEAQKVKLWEVVAVGPQVQNKIVVVGDKITVVQNPEVKIQPGMVVMIPESAGIDFEEDGQPFRVIRHSSIELYNDKQWWYFLRFILNGLLNSPNRWGKSWVASSKIVTSIYLTPKEKWLHLIQKNDSLLCHTPKACRSLPV